MSGKKRHRPGYTEKQLVHSINAAYWLTDTDAGAIQVARDLAAEIDALKRSEPSQGALFDAVATRSGKIAYVESNLHRLLTSLGLTPQGRRDLGFAMGESEVNPLDDLRTSVVQLRPVDGPPDTKDRDAENTGS